MKPYWLCVPTPLIIIRALSRWASPLRITRQIAFPIPKRAFSGPMRLGWSGACFVYFSSGMPFGLRMESMTAEISVSRATNDSGAHCRSFIRLISSSSRALWDTPGTPR